MGCTFSRNLRYRQAHLVVEKQLSDFPADRRETSLQLLALLVVVLEPVVQPLAMQVLLDPILWATACNKVSMKCRGVFPRNAEFYKPQLLAI